MRHRTGVVVAGLLLLGLGCPPDKTIAPQPRPPGSVDPADSGKPYPPTVKKVVEDSYHGVTVRDPYRWLEGSDDAVKRWSAAQNSYTRSVLDALPQMAPVRARMTEVLSAETASYDSLSHRGGKLFAMKVQPPKQQPFLIVMPSADEADKAQVVVDPNAIDEKGTTAIDFFVPSWDGKLVAVSLSKGGTQTGDLHVYEVVTGKEVHEVIPRVNGGTAGGTLVWSPDNKGFYYSRYPRAGERPEGDLDFYVRVHYHALGTPPDTDRYELGEGFPRIAELELHMDPKSGRVLCTAQNGDGGEFSLHLRAPDGRWTTFAKFEDRMLQAAFGPKDDLYVLSRKDAERGKILRVRIDQLDLAKAETVVPEGEDTIVESFWSAPSVLPTKHKLYVLYQRGGPSEIRVFDHAGKALAAPPQLSVGAADGMTRTGDDDILFSAWSFVEPPAFYRVSGKDAATQKTALASVSPVDMSQVRVVREMATSKDGTRVPVNILLPAGYKDGSPIPCVVNGYGGYGVSVTPRFRPIYSVLLEQGVCYALANLRGGGEFGEEWHAQGSLTHKQNVFDDFEAVLRHLVERGYSRSDKLAVIGASNGGLLMGALLTQHPTLVKAVVSSVGIYDMLRTELSANGAFNVTEFGSVKDPAQFEALYAYSPYHRVKDGIPYPATLLLSGENDPRVDPMQSRKMVARLQAATASAAPILLRTNTEAGHGGDKLSDVIAEMSDSYTFIFAQLGVTCAAR